MQIEAIVNAASCRDVVQPVHRLKPEGCVECPGILSTYQNLAFFQVLILTPTMAFTGTLHKKKVLVGYNSFGGFFLGLRGSHEGFLRGFP